MRKWQVYISSTFLDLKAYRAQLKSLFEKELSRHFELRQIMEKMFDENTYTPFVDDCTNEVKSCDIYILIIGNRAGSLPVNEDRTYTEIEFDTAIEKKKYIICTRLAAFDEAQIDDKVRHARLLGRLEGRPSHSFTDWKELENILYRQLNQFIGKSPVESSNPYKGLAAFTPGDGDYFFGRSAEIDDCIKKIVTHKKPVCISVIGNSGIGKTSFAQAGILYRLKTDQALGFSHYKQVIVTPGSEPYTNLKYQLHIHGIDITHSPDTVPQSLILFLNQLEEVITQCHSETALEEVKQFFSWLDNISQERPGPTNLVIISAFRSDFISGLANFDFIKSRQIFFPLNSLDFRINTNNWETAISEIITQPALRHGVTVEQELVSQLMNEIREVDGSLPILQFTLQQVWNEETVQDGKITSTEYNQLAQGKGIAGIIEVHAERVIADIVRGDQEGERERILKSIFVNLVEVNENVADIKKTVKKHELQKKLHAYYSADAVNDIFEALVNEKSRLLVVTEARDQTFNVDIIHEVLIRKWERLRSWINERRAALLFRERLLNNMDDWERSAHDPELLLPAKRWQQAQTWLADNRDLYDDAIYAYIEKSARREALLYQAALLKDIDQWKEDKRSLYKGEQLFKLQSWARNNPDLVNASIQSFTRASARRKRVLVQRAAIFAIVLISGMAAAFYYNKQQEYRTLCQDSSFMGAWKEKNKSLNADSVTSLQLPDQGDLQLMACFPVLDSLSVKITNTRTAINALKELTGLTTLFLNFEKDSVSSLDELKRLKKLRQLTLQGHLADLDGIEKNPTLQILKLDLTSIRNVEKIGQLENLKRLDLKLTNINDNIFTVLQHCPKLQTLNLRAKYDGASINLAELERLPGLRTLHLYNLSMAQNTHSLEKLQSLDSLTITYYKDFNSLRLLKGATQLKSLVMEGVYGLESLDGIEAFTYLTVLDLSDMTVRDLIGIEKLSRLKKIRFDASIVRTEELRRLSNLPIKEMEITSPRDLSFVDSLASLETLKIKELRSTPMNISINNKQLKNLKLSGDTTGSTSVYFQKLSRDYQSLI